MDTHLDTQMYKDGVSRLYINYSELGNLGPKLRWSMGVRCQAVKTPSSAISSSFLHRITGTEETWALPCSSPAIVSGYALRSTTH